MVLPYISGHIEQGQLSCRKVPKFSDAKYLAVIHLIFKQGPNLKVFCQKHAKRIANSEDPDQTALIRVCTVCPGLYVRKLRIITVTTLFLSKPHKGILIVL